VKVLLATNDFPPLRGGIATVSLGIVRSLLGTGHEVFVLLPWQCVAAARQTGAKVMGVPGYGLMGTRIIGMWTHLACALHRWHPDVVMGMNVSYVGPVQCLTPPGDCRWVLAAFGYEFLKWPRVQAFQRMIQASYVRADAILTVSDYMKRRLMDRGIDPHKIHPLHVSPTGLPDPAPERVLALRSQWGGGDPLLLTVARLVKRKGIDVVIRALAQVLEVVPSARYWVVGDGPDRERLEGLARGLGVHASVAFLGEVSPEDMAACYGTADLFVMTPVSDERRGDIEGLGLTFVEAALAGLPCVGSDSGGVPEAVADEETGLIVPEKDVKALAEALSRLARDEALRRAWGSAGRQRAQRLFGEESMSADLSLLIGGTHVV
jgi:phosphatidylinositol alpha-1,6-mannosyltransferase